MAALSRLLFAAGVMAALPAFASEPTRAMSADLATQVAFEVCPAMIERGDGSVTKEEISRFQFQNPLDGGDRTLWAIGDPKNAIALAWLPNRQECSVMHSGSDQVGFFEKLGNALSNLDGYVRTFREDDGNYITEVFNRSGTTNREAAHYVIVKTNDGRWVNVWYGKGTR
jgi:hypothetical protein